MKKEPNIKGTIYIRGYDRISMYSLLMVLGYLRYEMIGDYYTELLNNTQTPLSRGDEYHIDVDFVAYSAIQYVNNIKYNFKWIYEVCDDKERLKYLTDKDFRIIYRYIEDGKIKYAEWTHHYYDQFMEGDLDLYEYSDDMVI